VEQIVPDGEAQKTSEVAAECWATAGKAAITRSDAIVAVGGGATTDLGGFIAATWLRGIAVVQVATTLLAMVDAAVGGKTGINTAEGKNLVGAFHQPAAVFCDLEFLETLPARDFTAGLGEVVKYGLISDKEILGLIENNAAELNPWKGAQTDAKTWQVVEELVRRAVAVKAEVTSGDPTEKGVREFLNYGHTLGHAIEHGEHFTWRHGEAVAVGMVFAAELAALAGLLTAAEVARHRALLTAVGLPVRYSKKTLADLLPAMGRDKKTRGNRMRFIVLDGIGNPTRLVAPDQDSLEKAFQNIAQPC
jgi:3-dehydroquinate synthase